MTPEAKVKRKVTTILKDAGVYHFYPVMGGFGSSGVPDIVGCHNGKFFAIECKAKNNKTTALQDRHIQKIKDSGGTAIVVNEENLNDVQDMLTQLQGV